MTSKLTIFLLYLSLLSGCSAITKPIKIDTTPPTSISVDAKQRLVIAINRGDTTLVCAEPSPDAFRALAASGGGNILAGGKEIGASWGMAESAGALAVRTQTIQLL